MVDFTTILNKGIRRHIDKNMKRRKFGKCEVCEKPTLLISYYEANDKNDVIYLCEFCYTEALNTESE